MSKKPILNEDFLKKIGVAYCPGTEFTKPEPNGQDTMPETQLPPDMPRPFLDGDGDPVIPFNSDPKYHYWAGGQSLVTTLKELWEDRSDKVLGDTL